MVKRHFIKLLSVVAALALVSLIASGCDEKPSTGPDAAGQSAKNPGGSSRPRSPDTSNETTPPKKVGEKDAVKLVLYFSDGQSQNLVKEEREVPKTAEIARAALEELIKGPAAGNQPTLPGGTRLLGVGIADGLATVNFSEELVDKHPGGSAGERLTVYSVVNTLTEFSTIKAVRFHVEDRAIETIAGHMDLTGPVERDEGLLKP